MLQFCKLDVFKPVFLKQFHFLKLLHIFMTLLKDAKKVRVRKWWHWGTQLKRDVDKVCIAGYKKLLATQVENLPAVSHFNTNWYVDLLTTPKTLEQQWRNRLKEVRIRNEKFNCPVSNTTIGTNSDKRRSTCDEGLDRELSTCLTTNYKKRINSR